MFWKKKNKAKQPDSKIILGMVMLNDNKSFDIDELTADLIQNGVCDIQEPTGDNSSLVLRIEDELVAIGHLDFPVPTDDIEGTAVYAYNWKTVLEDTKNHKSHLVVTVMHGTEDQVKRFKIFTKVLCSLLKTTNSIGVYKGSQSLLIPKNDYLDKCGSDEPGLSAP